jgi:hypothetical protein
MVPVAGLPANAGVPGVVGVSAVPFEHDVAGGPAVTGFPAVDGVLPVASAHADPGIPILAGGFTYCTVQRDMLDYRYIGLWLSDLYFFCYRTIGISNIRLANSRNYLTVGYRIKASIYRTFGYRTQKKLSVAYLCDLEACRLKKLQ